MAIHSSRDRIAYGAMVPFSEVSVKMELDLSCFHTITKDIDGNSFSSLVIGQMDFPFMRGWEVLQIVVFQESREMVSVP